MPRGPAHERMAVQRDSPRPSARAREASRFGRMARHPAAQPGLGTTLSRRWPGKSACRDPQDRRLQKRRLQAGRWEGLTTMRDAPLGAHSRHGQQAVGLQRLIEEKRGCGWTAPLLRSTARGLLDREDGLRAHQEGRQARGARRPPGRASTTVCPFPFLNLRSCVSPRLGSGSAPAVKNGGGPGHPASAAPPSPAAHLAGAAAGGASAVQQGLGHGHPQLRPLQVELHQQVPAAPAQHAARQGPGCWVGGAPTGGSRGPTGKGAGALTCRPTAGCSPSGAPSPS